MIVEGFILLRDDPFADQLKSFVNIIRIVNFVQSTQSLTEGNRCSIFLLADSI